MQYYINIRRVVMVNDLFYEFSEVTNDETAWKVRCAPEFLIADLDLVAVAGRHCFTLGTYKDYLGIARELSFCRSYYLGSFM